ncbi:uncharacterized protein [Ptychodera flava]|uniref:uncharacterized protein n=1 Tax=Ptychodera flava TaxID=63121 RepID=UPI00396A3C96
MKHGVHTNIYSTVLDVEVTESQRKEAEGSGVILIPARRKANLDPKKYPPNLDWLINHEIYYPKLKDLTGVLYVVGSDPLTKDAAKDIRENIFPSAELILLGSSVPQAAGVLVVFDRWDITKCGLAHFHRALVKNVRERLGEFLKLYATILDADISGVEKKDAEDAGVTLIPASRNESIDPTDDPIGVHYLFYHKGYYPHLRDLKNIKYVVGYAPMTANAAADIRKSLFPSAKLFQINQLNPDNFCKLKNGDSSKLVKKMVNIAREADAVASIGPGMHDYFENAYRAITDMSIAHIEILPNFGDDFAVADIKLPENVRHHTLLSYGVTCTGEDGAVDEYETIADAVGKVATTMHGLKHTTPKWNVLGVRTNRNEVLQTKITEKMNCKFSESRIMPDCSPADLMDKLLTSHLCIIGQCRGQYGLYGLESIAAGLPTLVSEKADLGCLMNRYFEDHAPMFVVRREEDWVDKISFTLSQTNVAFKSANTLKKAYLESTAVKDCCARFSSLFTEASTPSQDLDVTITLDDQPWQDRFTDIEKRIDVLSQKDPIDKTAITALQDDMRQTLQALKRCQQGLKRKADEIVNDDSQPLKFVCRNADLGINNITQTKSGRFKYHSTFSAHCSFTNLRPEIEMDALQPLWNHF